MKPDGSVRPQRTYPDDRALTPAPCASERASRNPQVCARFLVAFRGLDALFLYGTESLRLLDISAVAERLAVTECHVRRLVAEQRIPYVKIGRFVRFDPDDIDEWIGEARVRPRCRRTRFV